MSHTTWFGTQWKFTESASFSSKNPLQNPSSLVPKLSPKQSAIEAAVRLRRFFVIQRAIIVIMARSFAKTGLNGQPMWELRTNVPAIPGGIGYRSNWWWAP
jgi:hypothetical protein